MALYQFPGLLVVEQAFLGQASVAVTDLLLGKLVRVALGYLLAVGPFDHFQGIPAGNA